MGTGAMALKTKKSRRTGFCVAMRLAGRGKEGMEKRLYGKKPVTKCDKCGLTGLSNNRGDGSMMTERKTVALLTAKHAQSQIALLFEISIRCPGRYDANQRR